MQNDKIGFSAWLSGVFTFISGLSLPDWACLVGLCSTLLLTGWKIYVDCKHLQYEKQALSRGSAGSFSNKDQVYVDCQNMKHNEQHNKEED